MDGLKKGFRGFRPVLPQVELEADIEGLMIMARAGYHPDFVPALHHLLQARASSTASIYSMHPGWDTRDRQAQRFYATASIDFDRCWPDRYASPGGNPPTLVFAEEPHRQEKWR